MDLGFGEQKPSMSEKLIVGYCPHSVEAVPKLIVFQTARQQT